MFWLQIPFRIGNNNNDIVFCTFRAAGPLSVMVPNFSPFNGVGFKTFSVVDVYDRNFLPFNYIRASNNDSSIVMDQYNLNRPVTLTR
jgi:hypothetical protein